jgi:uncharacterized membrane protein HdeD (DUF308 family)
MQTTDSLRQDVSHIPWWIVMLQGIAVFILGLLLVTAPTTTTLVLVGFVGAYWLVTGIFSIVNIFVDNRLWGWKLLSGIIGILAGIMVIQHPLWSAFLLPATLVTLLAIGGIIIGVSKLIQAFRGGGLGEGILGLVSIAFGVLLLSSPVLATITFIYSFGILAMVGGLLAFIASFRLRQVERVPAAGGYRTTSPIPVTGAKTRDTDMPDEDRPDQP